MQSQNYDIETLNELIKTTIDSVDGYRAAAEDADSRQYQSLFVARANEREEITRRLQAKVSQLGGSPTESGSIAAGAHRVFMNLREALTGNDDAAVVAEVERGEDHIKNRYETALTDLDLSSETKELIGQCFESVKAGHDQMRDLKVALVES